MYKNRKNAITFVAILIVGQFLIPYFQGNISALNSTDIPLDVNNSANIKINDVEDIPFEEEPEVPHPDDTDIVWKPIEESLGEAKESSVYVANELDTVAFNPLSGVEKTYPANDPSHAEVSLDIEMIEEYRGLLETNTPESVIGTDDRVRITPTTSFPWRTVVKLYITAADATHWVGSGAILDGFHVLTAGHCVHMDTHGGWVSSIEVVPAMDNAYDNYGRAISTFYRSYAGWTVSQMPEHDWSVINLDRNVGLFTGWMGRLTAPSTDPIYDETINLAGYPADLDSGNNMYYDFNLGDGATTYNHYYFADTSGGMSGCPVWRLDSGNRYILTVHAYGRGSVLSNYGTRLDTQKYNHITTWLSDDASSAPTDYADLEDRGSSYSGYNTGTVTPGVTSFNVWNDVRNTGTATASGYYVRYYASINTIISIGDYLIGSDYISSTTPFTYSDASWSGIFPNGIPAGNYYIGWLIDVDDDVDEVDEGNNRAYISSQVTVETVIDLVDRGPGYSSFSPTEVIPGRSNISIYCDIQNTGNIASGNFNVSFRASTNTFISISDYEIGKITIPSISAASYADVYFYGTIPDILPFGTYYVGWLIDVDGDVSEGNEGNNNPYETSYQLEVVNKSDLLDRGPIYHGFSPTEGLPGVTTIDIWADILNNGLVPSGPFNVSFRASTNTFISISDYEIGKITVPSISNGTYSTISYTGILPVIPFGTYYIGWLIDVDDDVDEVDEGNNRPYVASYQLDVVNKSDLIDRGSIYSGISTTVVKPGVTPFGVWADIGNRGLKLAESFNVSFYASLDTNITTSDYFLGMDTTTSILNGTYADVEWSGTFPNIPEGSYYIGWVIDVDDDVDEAHENNNQAYITSQLIVDNTAPTSSISFTPITSPNIVDTSTEFTLSASDGSGSGVFNISYRIDEGTWNLYTGNFTLSGYGAGNHTIEYYATDSVGNNEGIKSTIVIIIPEEVASLIPGFNPLILIGIISVISIIVMRKKLKKF